MHNVLDYDKDRLQDLLEVYSADTATPEKPSKASTSTKASTSAAAKASTAPKGAGSKRQAAASTASKPSSKAAGTLKFHIIWVMHVCAMMHNLIKITSFHTFQRERQNAKGDAHPRLLSRILSVSPL